MFDFEEINNLKCVVRIDYDIPFDFKETREQAYEVIINKLHEDLDHGGYDHGVIPDYTTCSTIVLYCPTKEQNNWRGYVIEAFKDLRKIEVKDEDTFVDTVVESYDVEYYLEFSYSENYHIR